MGDLYDYDSYALCWKKKLVFSFFSSFFFAVRKRNITQERYQDIKTRKKTLEAFSLVVFSLENEKNTKLCQPIFGELSPPPKISADSGNLRESLHT